MKKKKWIGLVLTLCMLLGDLHVPVAAAKAANKPKLDVQYKEVSIKKAKMKKDSKGNMIFSAVIKNGSKTGTIKKIQYYYKIKVLKTEKKKETVFVTEAPVVTDAPLITEAPLASAPAVPEATSAYEPVVSPEGAQVPDAAATAEASPGAFSGNDSENVTAQMPVSTPEQVPEPSAVFSPAVTDAPVVPSATPKVVEKTVIVTKTVKKAKTVVMTAKKIKPGKTSARVSCTGDYSGKTSAMKLVKVKLYAGDALYTYDAEEQEGEISWAVKDKKGPVFSGWIGDASIYSGITIRVCYADRKDTYSFKDHVEAIDARDGKVGFTVDTSGIDWNQEGIYKVIYTAKDSSGNQTKAWAKVQVYKKGTAESIADEVLRSTISSSWSDERKARAIYSYVRGHCSYTGEGSHTNWRDRAAAGIRYRSGDCFTYYSVARLLLTRAGVPNLEVTRYPKRTGSNHWWSLVYVRDGWYHLDTTPRRRDGKFCLVTYNQLLGYSSGRTFRHRTDILPKEATKAISANP